jgi:hypothetical protein
VQMSVLNTNRLLFEDVESVAPPASAQSLMGAK